MTDDAARLAEILAPANFVIRRRDGAFVCPPGHHTSYSMKLQDAWTFSTYDEAERNVCPGNENVAPIVGIFKRRFEPGGWQEAAHKAKQNRMKGMLPPAGYMYVGSMSIGNALKLDQGTVPGCEYLQEYWDLRLLIAKQADTERKLMIAAGTYANYTGDQR